MGKEDSTDTLTMDLRLIPEFDGAGQAVAEWLEKLELVCRLRGVTKLEDVVPLRLTGGAFSVYQQLSSTDKGSYDKIKAALTSAFAVDKFIAYEQFVDRKLRDGESVDVYLADLRRLAVLFGGIPDAGLSCAFVAGLPDSARHVLRASSRLEEMDIHQIVTRARAVLAEENLGAGAASFCNQPRAASTTAGVLCRACNQPNHYARSCLARRGWRRGGRGNVRCYGCGQPGHLASSCPGNYGGEAAQASVPSPDYQ
ncbi:hypothetical protein Pmani_000020 [Petrolisthes manimaculis]|uniref:CCHC-type domain-containing protein n=1 Tax=Petrolisthes manimaculis TaxID=1843537 RepID=A0AAE1UKS0_9EUCA|nr:hypothetical protein Pmani_013365 [Petrolisthes manimaculis]KAK4325383.1 hypothetical protein Pmani_004040 [Petrolisthes manimaculis]KAK4327488.1 hypothetical protein Pmani_002044 [Petrolisthes manimaculis]KAK4328638.1 hypothetical protein Pmani_000947 [Petrolisthes manimaculis]KAK4329617.1 hypothetical protein Pmani_000020 [Petrolisthes manimaculis]